ncbi:MAG: hypothetical protein HY518_00220 [Candidatus Aenigmarchaeota archaeon]|nr:hypothetical protein [Candidatus Aenigmarchaeota archaeon]
MKKYLAIGLAAAGLAFSAFPQEPRMANFSLIEYQENRAVVRNGYAYQNGKDLVVRVHGIAEETFFDRGSDGTADGYCIREGRNGNCATLETNPVPAPKAKAYRDEIYGAAMRALKSE